MAVQEKTFQCDIVDSAAQEHFHASVKVVKKAPITASSFDKGRIELAHVYITALADLWKGSSATFTQSAAGQVIRAESDIQYAVRDGRPKEHSHFVLFDASGGGKYIRRNRYGKDLEARQCSMWDLGPEFGTKLARTLAEFV